MAESYCLKSCTECAQEGCAGCRAGAFAWQCEVIKCCKEKNHESCESCTNISFCRTRGVREQMPEKVFAARRREAELLVKYRADADVIAKWTGMAFWFMIAMNVFSLIGLLKELVPVLHWVELIGSAALMAGVCFCMLRMQMVDERFRSVAMIELVLYAVSVLAAELIGEGKGLLTVIQLMTGAVAIYVMKVKSETFRDVLSGISREMSGKWEGQWDLYKKSLFIELGGIVALLVLPVVGLIALVVGVCLLLFVQIREYVYLYQTARSCREFSGE